MNNNEFSAVFAFEKIKEGNYSDLQRLVNGMPSWELDSLKKMIEESSDSNNIISKIKMISGYVYHSIFNDFLNGNAIEIDGEIFTPEKLREKVVTDLKYIPKAIQGIAEQSLEKRTEFIKEMYKTDPHLGAAISQSLESYDKSLKFFNKEDREKILSAIVEGVGNSQNDPLFSSFVIDTDESEDESEGEEGGIIDYNKEDYIEYSEIKDKIFDAKYEVLVRLYNRLIEQGISQDVAGQAMLLEASQWNAS